MVRMLTIEMHVVNQVWGKEVCGLPDEEPSKSGVPRGAGSIFRDQIYGFIQITPRVRGSPRMGNRPSSLHSPHAEFLI